MIVTEFVWVVLALICCACLCSAETIYIGNSNFSFLVKKAKSPETTVIDVFLVEDINASVLKEPLCYSGDDHCRFFQGTFDGGNHTIYNANIIANENNTYGAGLFCGLKNAVVKNLIISETCSFTGKYAGGLFGRKKNKEKTTIKIQNVINYATINGNQFASGFIGSISNNPSTTLEYEDCVNYGTITIPVNPTPTYNYASAFFSYSYNINFLTVSMKQCKNFGKIIATGSEHNGRYIGGMLGYFDSNPNMEIQLSGCENNGELNVKQGFPTAAGGIIGHISCVGLTLNMTNNANNGSIIVPLLAKGAQSFIGGLIGRIKNNPKQITLSGNINNGEIHSQKDCLTGGLIGLLSSENYSAEVSLNNNINNGNIYSNFSVSQTGVIAIGGLIGQYSCDCHAFNRNINKGHISISAYGSNNNEKLYVGGCFGYIDSHSIFQMNNSTNEGDVVVSSSSIPTSFTAGLIGSVEQSNQWEPITIKSCENVGSIKSNSIACGLICSQTGTVIVTNSVSKGSVSGNSAYGIAEYVNGATNAVVAGRINCSIDCSFCEHILGIPRIYVLKDNYRNCSVEEKPFELRHDGYYYLPQGERIDIELNDVAKINGDTLWSPELRLCYGDVCKIVVSGNVMNKTQEVECGTKLSEIPEISKYVGREGYVVSDVLNDKNVALNDTIITCYLHIAIYDVKENPYVLIKVDPTEIELININVTLGIINNETGIDKDSIIIDYVLDGDGRIIYIVLYVNTKDEADLIAEFVKQCL